MARNSIDFGLLLSRLPDVDYNWLLTGKGIPRHRPNYCYSPVASGEVELLHTPKSPDPLDERSVTLYDVTAAANLKTLLADGPSTCWERYRYPTSPVATAPFTSAATRCTPS